MPTLHRWLPCATLSLLIATASAAQDSPRRFPQGLWLEIGYGVAHNDLQCTGCNTTGPEDPWNGGTGGSAYAAGGRALSQHVLAGIEVGGSGTSGGGREATLFNLLLVGHYYPSDEGSFHLKGGIGPVIYLLSGPYQGQGGGVSASGWAGQVGVGYDIRVWRHFALAPYASVTSTTVRQSSIQVSGSGGSVTGLQNHVVTQLGVALRASCRRGGGATLLSSCYR